MIKKTSLLLATLFVLTQIKAQSTQNQAISVSIGLGISTPYDAYDLVNTGFYAQGEYIYTLTNWVDFRPYAGLILTKGTVEDINQPFYRATARAFLIGGKTRITAPIPWIAPFIEIGVGASMGSFATVTPFTNLEENGLSLHIPFSIGLELGPKHNVDIEFTYYFHNSAQLFSGAAAFGVTIPL